MPFRFNKPVLDLHRDASSANPFTKLQEHRISGQLNGRNLTQSGNRNRRCAGLDHADLKQHLQGR
jgi:hypothetical protein